MGATGFVQPNWFFYKYLTHQDSDKVVRLLEIFREETKAIELQIVDIVYVMKGGITLHEAMLLSSEQKQLYMDRVEQIVKETGGSDKEFM